MQPRINTDRHGWGRSAAFMPLQLPHAAGVPKSKRRERRAPIRVHPCASVVEISV